MRLAIAPRLNWQPRVFHARLPTRFELPRLLVDHTFAGSERGTPGGQANLCDVLNMIASDSGIRL